MKAKSPKTFLRKKMLRQTLKEWKQFFAILLIGAIATTLFIGLTANAESLSSRVETVYREGDLPDMWVMVDPIQSANPLTHISSVLDEGDILDSRFQLGVEVNSSPAYMAVSNTLPTLSHPIEILESSPRHDERHFFLVDTGFAARYNSTDNPVKPGENATISINLADLNLSETYLTLLDGYVRDGQTPLHREKEIQLKAPITGIMTYPENIQTAAYSTSTCLLSESLLTDALVPLLLKHYQPTAVTRVLSLFRTPNVFMIKTADSSTIEAKEAKIREVMEDNGLLKILDRKVNPWSITADMEVEEAKQLTLVFPLVFFLVGLLVIMTTIRELILKERTQIGTFKALGLRKRDIYWHYISLVLTLVGISTAIGAVVGPLLLPAIMDRKYAILYTLPQRPLFYFPHWQSLLVLLFFLAAGALVAFIACYKEVRLNPVQSMRSDPVHFSSRSAGIPKKKLSSLLLSFKMAMRNIRVSKQKSFMVVAGVAGCTALLVCGFGIENTLDHGIERDLSLFYTGDVTITYSANQTGDVPSFASNPYVKSYDQYLAAVSTMEAGDYSTSSRVRFFSDDHPYLKQSWPKGTVAISSKVSSALHLEEGSAFTFDYAGVDYSATVGLIYETFSIHGIFALFSDYPDIPRLYSGAWADSTSSPSQLKESLYAMDKSTSPIADVKTYEDMTSFIQSVIGGVYLMTNAIKAFAIALAVVVLYNLALLNYRERIREIATLKVLGFRTNEIALSLITETLVLTCLGGLFGLALGYPFMYAVLYVNQVALVEFLYFITSWTYVFAFFLSLVVSFLVNLVLSYLTKKVAMVESLKSVE